MREQEDGARKVEPCSPHKMNTTESSRYWDASRSDNRKDHSSRGSGHREPTHRHTHGSGRSSADDPAFTPTRSKSSVPSNARNHPVADLRKDGSSRHGALNHMHNHVSEEMSRDRKRRRSEEEEEVWTEHRSSSGRIYFYNKKLDKSQWERPSKGSVKRVKPESQNQAKASASGGSSASRTSTHSSSRTHAHSSSTGTSSNSGKSSREHHLHSSGGSSHTPSRRSHSALHERAGGSKPSSSAHHSGQRTGNRSSVMSPSTPVVPSKKPQPAAILSPSSQPLLQPLPGTPQTPTLPFPPPFLNHTPRFPPPFVGTPESPIVASAPQLLPQSSSAPFCTGVGQQNGPVIRPVPLSMSWIGGMVQPHPCVPPPAMDSPGLHPLQKALFLQNQLSQPAPPQSFVTSPAQLPMYALPLPPPHLATPPPALPQLLMAAPPVTPAEVPLQQHQHQQPVVLQQPQSQPVLIPPPQQQHQPVYVKPTPSLTTTQAQQQLVPAQGLPSSHVLRVPMSRLGSRSGNEIINPEFPDPASLKPPPQTTNADFFSRVLSDTWWTNALDTCCKQMDRSHLECLSRKNVDSAYHSGQLAKNLLNVECCRMIAISRTTRITYLRELMADIEKR